MLQTEVWDTEKDQRKVKAITDRGRYYAWMK